MVRDEVHELQLFYLHLYYGQIRILLLYCIRREFVRDGEESSCLVVIRAFGHNVIDGQVHFTCVTYWVRFFSDVRVGWMDVSFSDLSDYCHISCF